MQKPTLKAPVEELQDEVGHGEHLGERKHHEVGAGAGDGGFSHSVDVEAKKKSAKFDCKMINRKNVVLSITLLISAPE